MSAILAGLSNSYTTALGHVTAALAVKIGVLNLATVRSRTRLGTTQTRRERPHSILTR